MAPLLDLNDLRLFAAVVEHEGFSAAGRALGLPKSRLSQRVARLEESVGFELLRRTSRRFAVTPVGEQLYTHARAVVENAEAAREALEMLRSEPCGEVRLSCPVSLSQTAMARLIPEFLKLYPRVKVRLLSTNRPVDLIEEGYDLAIRVRPQIDGDASLVVRKLEHTVGRLVASPSLLEHYGRPTTPDQLKEMPTLSMVESEGRAQWTLSHADGTKVAVSIEPRLVTGDFKVLLDAARAGVGVAWLPDLTVGQALRAGELEAVLPEWSTPSGIAHMVYPTRRGLLPAVRALVDFLAERLDEEDL